MLLLNDTNSRGNANSKKFRTCYVVTFWSTMTGQLGPCPQFTPADRPTGCWQLVHHKSLHHYRPQTKFAKVMFSQVSVCPQGRGVCHTPLGRHSPRQTPPLGRPYPLCRHPPGQTPPAQCTLGYGEQAGGTHLTGMLSFMKCFLFYSCQCNFLSSGCEPLSKWCKVCVDGWKGWRL